MDKQKVKSISPWLMLISRPILFSIFQVLIAGVFLLFGSDGWWEEAEAWWMFSVIFTNLISILLLYWLFNLEDKEYFDFIQFSKKTIWKDIGLFIVIIIVIIPIATYPSQWLAELLFNSQDITFDLMFRPLPVWAIIVSILFPITIAFAELPTYFGYSMPRLENQINNGWTAWALSSFFLTFQHIAIPLIFDWRFMVWRIGMFIPFAFFVGLILKLRPQLFAYLMFAHTIIDMMTVLILFTL